MSADTPAGGCAGGVRGTPCDRPATTLHDGIGLCSPHGAGRRAVRSGGALNDNGKPRSLYLLRRGASWKVGIAVDVRARVRDAVARHRGEVRLIATTKLPPTHLGLDGPVGHCIEHSVRLQFAMLSITGMMLNEPGPEWVTTDSDQTDEFGVDSFRLAVDWVLMEIEDSMLIRQGRDERWRIRGLGPGEDGRDRARLERRALKADALRSATVPSAAGGETLGGSDESGVEPGGGIPRRNTPNLSDA